MDTDNTELKKRSRRRLVGAAALALLAAILLPMVMDQEPRPSGQDIQVSIPDRESELSRPIAGRAAGGAELPPPPQEAPPAAVETPLVQTPAPSPVEGAPRSAQAPAPSVSSPGAASLAAPPASAGSSTADTPPAPQDEAARVRAILEGKTPPPAVVAGSSFVVQVAAFGDAAKAGALENELKGKGFAAFTERAGNVTRVRVGPFTARAEADRAASRLKALGQEPVVTAR